MPLTQGHKLSHGGKRPGSGRKTNKVRHLCAIAFAERIHVLKEIADDEEGRPPDRMAALALLAKVGIPAQWENLGETPTGIQWQLPPLPSESK